MSPDCGHPTGSGETCERTVAEAGAHCFMHSGNGSPPGHGAPIGNTNAAGNSGGGAPTGNTNAEKYGGWNDPLKEYDRLTGETKAYVTELEADIIERSKVDLPAADIERKARRLAVLLIQDGRGWGYAVRNNELAVKREHDLAGGGTVMRWELNPAILADHRGRSKQWKLSRELCLFPSSDA